MRPGTRGPPPWPGLALGPDTPTQTACARSQTPLADGARRAFGPAAVPGKAAGQPPVLVWRSRSVTWPRRKIVGLRWQAIGISPACASAGCCRWSLPGSLGATPRARPAAAAPPTGQQWRHPPRGGTRPRVRRPPTQRPQRAPIDQRTRVKASVEPHLPSTSHARPRCNPFGNRFNFQLVRVVPCPNLWVRSRLHRMRFSTLQHGRGATERWLLKLP